MAGSGTNDTNPHYSSPRRLITAGVWIMPIVFWILVFRFTWRLASNVPYWDTWELTELVTGQEPVTLATLWRQHNEHRLVLQKLFEVALAQFTHWNLWLGAFVPGILIGANSCLVIARTLRSRPDWDPVVRVLLVAALTLILFNFRQHVQFIHEMVMCWGVLAIAMTAFAWRFKAYAEEGRGFWLLLVLLVVATLATGQGLALAVFVLIAWPISFLVRSRLPTGLPRSYPILAAASIALIVVYFVGYVKPVHHPPVTFVLTHHLEAIEYIAALAGSPFAWTESPAEWIGAFVLLLLAVGFVAMDRGNIWETLWQLMMDHSLIVLNMIIMCTIMVGRVGFGPGQATASHYVPFNALFVVSVLLLALEQVKNGTAWRVLLAALVIALLPAWYLGYRNGVAEMAVRHNGLQAYRRCALENPTSLARCDNAGVYAIPELLVHRGAILRDHGLSLFAERH